MAAALLGRGGYPQEICRGGPRPGCSILTAGHETHVSAEHPQARQDPRLP